MWPPLKVLTSISLYLYIQKAFCAEPNPPPSIPGYLYFEENKHLLKDEQTHIDDPRNVNFFLTSLNRPSKVSFRRGKTPDSFVEAIIERFNSDGNTGKVCTLPTVVDKHANNFFILKSTTNDVEILKVIRTFPNIDNNVMIVFVMDMKNCESSKTEILRGHDFDPKEDRDENSFLVQREQDPDSFDIFIDGIKSNCDTRICKRTFNVVNQTISDSKNFTIVGNSPNWWLVFIDSLNDDEYFALIHGEKLILLSLSSSGQILKSLDFIDWEMLPIHYSSVHDAFSVCYRNHTLKTLVTCINLDRDLNRKFESNIVYQYEPWMMGLRNLPGEPSLLLLTVRCLEEEVDLCKNTEIIVEKQTQQQNLTEIKKVANFTEQSCAVNKMPNVRFFQENNCTCFFYECDVQRQNGWEKIIKSKCI